MKIFEKVDLKYNIAKKIYGLAMMLDNCGNCNFNKNGEQKFIHELFSDLKRKTQINLFDVGGEIYYDTKGSALASMYQRNLKIYNNELSMKEHIKTKRLDEYIEQKKINHIDFIKVDVEGNEMRVFTGMGRYLNPDFVDYIQFEYGGTNLDSMTSLMNFFELFESKRFILAKVMPGGLQIREYAPFLENFQYSNYVALSKRLIKT